MRKRYRLPPIVIGLLLSCLASGAVFPGSSYASTVRVARAVLGPLRRHDIFANTAADARLASAAAVPGNRERDRARKAWNALQSSPVRRASATLTRTAATSVRLFRPSAPDDAARERRLPTRAEETVVSIRLLLARTTKGQGSVSRRWLALAAPAATKGVRTLPPPARSTLRALASSPDGRLRERRVGAARPSQVTQVRTSIGAAIAQDALELVGRPYVWGGASPAVGFDCSGLVQYVLSEVGIAAPRTSWQQFQFGVPVSIDQLLPGDLLFFATYASGASHVGIYIGNGEFVNALNSSTGVIVSALSNPYFASRLLGARSPYTALAQSG
ncbi:MAG: NlpC/P60 family protein [Firmicutes bacterium]|nr:NlpC/P60 family protein [Bacillota bacterium]